MYSFTVDDNIRFFEEANKNLYHSIFEVPYLKLMQNLHHKYDCKIQLNMFYSYTPNSFSLANCSNQFRNELKQNSDWLKFSFHAKHNNPIFPYDGRDGILLKDFDLVMEQLKRIAGEEAIALTTTLHYVTASLKDCDSLYKRGVRALIGMFYNKTGRDALKYYLTEKQMLILRERSFYKDSETNMIFARNDMVINQISISNLVPILEATINHQNQDNFIQIMIHEQYFYSDYKDFQPDFADKLHIVLNWLTENGYNSCFLEDRISCL